MAMHEFRKLCTLKGIMRTVSFAVTETTSELFNGAFRIRSEICFITKIQLAGLEFT